MNWTPEWSAFAYASLGGLAINILRWLEHAQIPRLQRPETFKDPLYSAQFLLLPVIGGFVGYLYTVSGTALNPLLAVNVGVSAPLILKAMATAVPTRAPERTG